MSTVTNNEGKLIEVSDLQLPADYIYNFVVMYTGKYFETDWSLDRCFRAIVDRGLAEIKRQVKTSEKLAVSKAAGAVLKEFNMSPEEAKRFIGHMKALEAQKAEAAKVNGKTAKA
jgi:hypothetical protein